MITLVPFDLAIIDSNAIQFEGSTDIFTVLIEINKFNLQFSSKVRDASAIFFSKFFTRPDIQKTDFLEKFIKWSTETINKLKNDPIQAFYISGKFSFIKNY